MLHLVVERCHPGDVLVVATEPPGDPSAVIGELLATIAARARGRLRAVIDAGVRDIAELRAMGFPVWSRWITAQGTTKQGAGQRQSPPSCAPARRSRPVTSSSPTTTELPASLQHRAVEVARGVVERVAHENSLRALLAAGELTADILGLRDAAGGARIASDQQ